MSAPVVVVGIGADGWAGLADRARAAVSGADVLVGSPRQTDLVVGHHRARVEPLPVPLREGLRPLLDGLGDDVRVVVLASGDPMHHGIGRTLAELLGPDRVDVIGAPSSLSLACARLGWGLEDVDVVSAVGRPLERLAVVAHPGRRVLVLSRDALTPKAVATLLTEHGLGDSLLWVLSDLGGPAERVVEGVAASWDADPGSPLNIVAVQCLSSYDSSVGLVPGLADELYETDGQLTKQHVRAATLAALRPAPGELLWDIGGGSGSIGIEWLRAHPTCRAVTVEPRHDRVKRIRRNAERLGVPGLQVVEGLAPGALAGLSRPDAVFVGGGLTADGLVPAVLDALRPGGRLVANTVTLDSEALLFTMFRRYGGSLTRLEVSHADAVGGFTSWSPARPVTQWSVVRPEELPA